jgi:hypothetical protein
MELHLLSPTRLHAIIVKHKDTFNSLHLLFTREFGLSCLGGIVYGLFMLRIIMFHKISHGPEYLIV